MVGFYGIVFVEQFIQWMYLKAMESDKAWNVNKSYKSNSVSNTENHLDMEVNIETTSLHSEVVQNPNTDGLEGQTEEREEDNESDIQPAPFQELEVKKVVSEFNRNDFSNKGHFRLIVYIIALSFHGIFEGMTLALQSVESNVWSLCFAICVHRCVLAFKLGMDLCHSEEKQGTSWLCIGTFALISALGIVLGIVLSSGAMLYADVTVPEAILQSLATGTILYIVFFDILFKDLRGKDDMKRIGCSFVGFVLMSIVFAIITSW